ncbi:MAG TPA: DUF5132 domain-containing protein [Methylobacter sp.]|jgi:hypothetical protein
MNTGDFIKSGFPLGIAIGVGAAVLTAAFIPMLPTITRAARPTLRAAIKSGILLAEKGRELMAETNEQLEDIFAEARDELLRENGSEQAESATYRKSPDDRGEL